MSRKKKSNVGSSEGVNFIPTAKSYLKKLQSEYEKAVATGQATPELSYRPVLDEFFRELIPIVNPNVDRIFEPRKQAKAGRPDWRFFDKQSLGLYGYVEAKGLDTIEKINVSAHKKQIEKYLGLKANVILTDGIEFIFYKSSGGSREYHLVKKPISEADWSALPLDSNLEIAFRDFFKVAASRTETEEGLVKEMAKRAREMSESVSELVKLNPGEGIDDDEEATIIALKELQTLLKEHHDPALNTPEIFADFVAQVLSFGLLYAHRVVNDENDLPPERLNKITAFWSKGAYKAFTDRLRPFRAIIHILDKELDSTGRLGGWYKDCLLFLAHIKLDKRQQTAPDYHILYQNFLNAFDPETKFEFGTYFTPPELTSYAVRLTSALINSEMEDVCLYADKNKLIDPCCGTATFMEQLILQANDKKTLPFITGFEILPAPYALAHHRLSMIWNGDPLPPNVEIVLTNTLSDELERRIENSDENNLIKEEQDVARERCKPPLTLVIGNPPSSDSYKHADGDYFEIINGLVDDFRPPASMVSARQNIQKQLQNPFIKFLRWACNKLEHYHPGVFTLVLPASFAEHQSYRYARQWIVGRFPKLWVLDLDSDLRTGVVASSLFGTEQGRLLIIGMTTPNDEHSDVKISHASITALSRQKKLDELSKESGASEMLERFKPFKLDPQTFNFRPTSDYDRTLYDKFWALYPAQPKPKENESYIFERHCSGIKLAPSSLFVHVSKQLLTRRCREIGDETGFKVSEILTKWFKGQQKPPNEKKLSSAVRTAMGNALEETPIPINEYSYRPFSTPYALVSKTVLEKLAKMENSGTRARPEILAAFGEPSTIGIAVAPAPKDIGGDLHRFVSFCWNLPDNDLCKRGNAQVLCNLFPQYKKAGSRATWDSTPYLNIQPSLLQTLSDGTGLQKEKVASLFVYYAYAVLCSNSYLTSFKGALFRSADSENRPRIPIPKKADLFLDIAQKGEDLASLENPDFEQPLLPEFEAMTELFANSFKLTSFSIKEADGEMELFEDNIRRLSLSPISSEVLSYEAAGYQVLQQWLKLYTFPYLRTEFKKEHYLDLLEVMSRISRQTVLIEKIGSIVSSLLSDDSTLLRPDQS